MLMLMTVVAPAHDDATTPDRCYRCDYDLHTISDDQPCPECGLLAIRSRRKTDDLHDSRPRWLKSMAWGIRLMLLALLMGLMLPLTAAILKEQLVDSYLYLKAAPPAWTKFLPLLPLLGVDLSVFVLFVGAWLVTRAEGFDAADERDRWRRNLVRVCAGVPILAIVLQHIAHESARRRMPTWFEYQVDWNFWTISATVLLTVGCVPLPLLIFQQLRSLANRARSAHLAKFCTIVGTGTSVALAFLGGVILLGENAEDWGFGTYWTARSNIWLMIVLLMGIFAIGFIMSSIYLLLRFSIVFFRAARALQRQWNRDDRSLNVA